MAHQITIAWDASPGPVSGYNIYRGTSSHNEASAPLNGITPVVGTTFTDNTVLAGKVYYYEITAVLNGVESLDSLEVVSTAVPFPGAPSVLSGFDSSLAGRAAIPASPGSPAVPANPAGILLSFGVLAGSTITNVPGSNTAVNGDVGTSPGTSITGFGAPAGIGGVFHPGDFVSAAAESALAVAFADGMARTGAVTLTGDIGGQTLAPGVYSSASSLAITGTLTLDAKGDPNAVWVFQIGSTLTTAASNSAVVMVGGGDAGNVFWLVGSSATLGIATTFQGNILAQASITANTGAAIDGRLLAMTGAVTLDGNQVMVFLPCDPLLLPPSPPNTPPAPPTAPLNLRITSES
jgi:hypothetical protein